MIEKHTVDGRDVWVEIQQHPVERENSKIIPLEYFTARFFLEEPGNSVGELILDEDGNPRLFESPVAALTYASQKVIGMVSQ
jgi:hypothetical protein